MQIGQHIEIPGIHGAINLVYDLPEFTQSRRIKIWIVPEELSIDRYFVSIKLPGGLQAIPPSRSKDTILLVDFYQTEIDQIDIKYINPEVENA